MNHRHKTHVLINTVAILSPNNGDYAMKPLYKACAMLLCNGVAHTLLGVFDIVRKRDLGFWPRLGGGFAVVVAGTMGGAVASAQDCDATAIADEGCDATAVAEGNCAYAPVVSPDATVADARMAAMLHTPLPIEEIDAAIAAGVRKADELFERQRTAGPADDPTLAPETYPDPWQCRVRLTACITLANEPHHARLAKCDVAFEQSRRGCMQAAQGATDADREADYKLCMSAVKSERLACTSGSEADLYRETAICLATYNCHPLPA